MTQANVLDRDRAALVVVDVQERLAAAMGRRDSIISRTRFLISVASIVGMPIVVTRQYPRGLGDTEGPVAEALAQAEEQGAKVVRVDKVSFDCFAEPAFADAVRDLGVQQLLLSGMETHICITQTALAALRMGLEVHVCADACCSRDDENRQLALGRMQSAGAVITTSESAAYELVGAAGTDEFKSLLQVVKDCG